MVILVSRFFPNWQFFHKVGPVPHLYVRFQDTMYQWSDWEWVYPRRYRQLLDVFHNPSGNLLLAQQNLVDHLSSDIKDLGEGADARPLVQLSTGVSFRCPSGTCQQWTGPLPI
jgi:hypothetical protein